MSDSTHINELRKEIEALCDNCDRPNKEEIGNIILSAMVFGFGEGLKAPSADRPQGMWIYDEHKGTYVCSECGKPEEHFVYGLGEYWYGRGESNFCPNCGANMRKGADNNVLSSSTNQKTDA